jgi:hypothetical protein
MSFVGEVRPSRRPISDLKLRDEDANKLITIKAYMFFFSTEFNVRRNVIFLF